MLRRTASARNMVEELASATKAPRTIKVAGLSVFSIASASNHPPEHDRIGRTHWSALTIRIAILAKTGPQIARRGLLAHSFGKFFSRSLAMAASGLLGYFSIRISHCFFVSRRLSSFS